MRGLSKLEIVGECKRIFLRDTSASKSRSDGDIPKVKSFCVFACCEQLETSQNWPLRTATKCKFEAY